MRTMPMVLMSSVDVVSTARAQRMQRSTSTEALARGRLGAASMLFREESMERSESEEEADDDEADEGEGEANWLLGMVKPCPSLSIPCVVEGKRSSLVDEVGGK